MGDPLLEQLASPTRATLVKMACVLPVSSVPAERGFTLQDGMKAVL